MKRREFLRITGVGMGSLAIPIIGRTVPLAQVIAPIPNGDKKKLAEAALNAAKSKGATYADVRIGLYRNQFVITREEKVLNIVNSESHGAGVRVIVGRHHL